MTQNNRLWVLLSRRLSGEASPAELDELTGLLEQQPDQQYLLTILHTYFTAHPEEAADSLTASDDDLDGRLYKIFGSSLILPETTAAKKKFFPLFIKVAAAVTGILILGWALFHVRPTSRPPLAYKLPGTGDVIAGRGARTKLLLPDGTQVWLNAGSKLHYRDDFNKSSREVELEGEAFFDVVKDVEHPFIVHASALDIRVLGTAFTVKSYPQDATIEATLLRGAIEVYRQDNPNAPRIMLKPNEKLVFNKQLTPSAPGAGIVNSKSGTPLPDISVSMIPKNIPDSVKEETAWMYNKLVFNGDGFKELAEKMERWYNVKIIFKDERLYSLRFAGAFANETIGEAFAALQLTAKFRYEISNDEIKLYAK